MFLYSAVSNPLDRSKRFTLHPWQTCLRENYSVTLPPLSISRYSFLQPSGLRRHRETKMHKLQNGSKGRIRTRALSIDSQAFYRWATTLHKYIKYIVHGSTNQNYCKYLNKKLRLEQSCYMLLRANAWSRYIEVGQNGKFVWATFALE